MDFAATVIMLFGATAASAQQKAFDKADADRLVYEQLSANTGGADYHRSLVVNKEKLVDTSEDRIKLLPGKSFQISSLRSDVYVDSATGSPVFDRRYPMESAVNLLMNVVKENRKIAVTQHLYGNVKKRITTTLPSVFYVLAEGVDVYCNITRIEKDRIEADLVMHNAKQDVIHLFVVSIPMDQLFMADGKLQAELYANIPQKDIKNIYSRNKK